MQRLGFALLLLLVGLPTIAADTLPVVASFSILGDMVRQVGGDKVKVATLVGPNSDAHVYQPAPQDVHTLAGARLLVVNGLGFEGWIDRLVPASGYRGLRVTAADGVLTRMLPGQGRPDPHAWQDPARARRYIANIERGLAAADPANAAYYHQRATAYGAQLAQLEQWADAQVQAIAPAKRRVITSHDAFGYLGERFGIQFLAAQGLSTESEASPKEVGALIRQVRQQQVRALFVENISNPRLIAQIAAETGAKPGPELYSDALSKAGGPAADYLNMMRYNIAALVAGMKQN